VFAYYFRLSLRSFRRNLVLTGLMVLAIGVGIGASMTTLTIYRAMAADPIPGKSGQLFTPQIDNYGPVNLGPDSQSFQTPDRLPVNLTYIDAVALMRAHAAPRQAAMYATNVAVTPANPQQLPFRVPTRATYADFFPMFEVPFEYGAPWSSSDDESRSPLVVITRQLNDRLFGGANSVGRTLTVNGDGYRIVGVADTWKPTPRFYDLGNAFDYGGAEQLYLPFTRAIARQIQSNSLSCLKPVGSGWQTLLGSECIWTSLWVELPTAAAARAYRGFLRSYAQEQRNSGRFHWPARVALRNVPQWLAYRQIVPEDVSTLVLVSFAFLAVCLLNALGLMLAKFMARLGQVSVRRALGADQRAVLAQCIVESGTLGLTGAAAGLGFTLLGLSMARGLFGDATRVLTSLNGSDIAIAIAVSVFTTMLAGLYPSWRASQVQPAWQLKTQ
jgi:putative ABC transport system permease protein